MNKPTVLKALQKDRELIISKSEKVKNEIEVIKIFGKANKKILLFKLVFTKKGIIIIHPNYEFHSTVSHFCSTQRDIRLSLNKAYLKSIIRSLKKIGVWEAVINKDFLQINKNNPKSNKAVINRELRKLLG